MNIIILPEINRKILSVSEFFKNSIQEVQVELETVDEEERYTKDEKV
jgi:hypothetical protein